LSTSYSDGVYEWLLMLCKIACDLVMPERFARDLKASLCAPRRPVCAALQ